MNKTTHNHMLHAGRDNGAPFAVISGRMVLILATIMLACAVPSMGTNQVVWKPVSSFEYRWEKDGAAANFVLDVPTSWQGNGDFGRLRIVVRGERTFTLKSADGWVKGNSDSAGLPRKILQNNLVHSDYVLLLPVDGHERVLAFLFGWAYASSPGSIDVIELTPDNIPKLVLHRAELGLRAVEDLDGDGTAEVIGYPCLAQTWGNGLLTYDPYLVYKLSSAKSGKASLSLPLSKSYNLAHYYGWAGPDCREDIAVVLHPPGGGKPRIMSATEAQRLNKAAN